MLGHSVGEIAAAHCAGVIDLPTAMRLACHRGRVMAPLAGQGRMLAVGLPETEAAGLARRHGLDVASVNSPDTTVLSGAAEALTEIAGLLAAKEVFTRWLADDYPFHSSFTEHAAEELAAALDGLQPRPGDIPFVSSVLGAVCDGTMLDAGYWGRNVRDTVRFADGLRAALEAGADTTVEVGVSPVLTSAIRRTTTSVGQAEVAVLPAVSRQETDEVWLTCQSLADLYTRGCDIQWSRMYPGRRRVAAMPPYPFDRTRHWVDPPVTAPGSSGPALLIGTEIELAAGDGRRVWQAVLDLGSLPFLADHRVAGVVLFPAAALIDGAAALGAALDLPGAEVTDLTVHEPLLIGEQGVAVQWTAASRESGQFAVSMHSRGANGWRLHATATLRPAVAGAVEPVSAWGGSARARCFEQLPPGLLYQVLAFHGLDYGPAFRGVREAWRRPDEAVGRVAAADGDLTRLLDSAFHLVAAAAGAHTELEVPRGSVPVGVESVRQAARMAPLREAEVTVALRAGDSAGMVADLTLFAPDGTPAVVVSGLRLRALTRSGSRGGEQVEDLWRYRIGWSPRELVADTAVPEAGTWLVLADAERLGTALAEALTEAGHTVFTAWVGSGFRSVGERAFEADPASAADIGQLYAAAGGPALTGIVHLWSLELPAPVQSLVEVVKLVSSAAGLGMPRLLVGTRGAQPVAGTAGVRDPFGAALWGLVKGIPFENAVLHCSCVDLDPAEATPAAAARLYAELAAGDGETEIGYRAGARYVRRLRPAEPLDQLGTLPVRAGATYVITGGLGGLGLVAARWLAGRGAGHLVLLSRTADESHPGVAELRAMGAEVHPIAVDVADREALAAALDRVRVLAAPIAGVLHLAGTLADRPLLDMPDADLAWVLRPKVDGAWLLHELTAADPIELFVLYSSAASVLGSPGQANYSAANAFLDSLAAYRVGLGLPALAVSWGPWAEVGMARDGTALQRRLRTAASAIEPADGMAALEALLRRERGDWHEVVLPFDLRDLLQYFPAGGAMSFFDEITDQQVAITRNSGVHRSPGQRPDLGDYVAPRNDVERRIAAIWASAIGLDKVSAFDGFFELGGDSVFANQILIQINRALGVHIKPEQAFEALTVAGLAELANQEMLSRLADMTDEEAAALIAELE